MVDRGNLIAGCHTLDELRSRSDVDVIRIWLADRGLVAVERDLIHEVAALTGGNPFNVVYDATTDRYSKKKGS